MTGEFDVLYVAARKALLDCLEALEEHHEALVLVGAQAIYIHMGEADIAVSAFTKDADVMLEPALLATEPLLSDAMESAGFRLTANPGTWTSPGGIPVDLLVAAAVAGEGASHRGARLPIPHGNKAARRVKGLEAALVDHEIISIESLSPDDERGYQLRVAGTAALFVAKLHKIGERTASPNRLMDKDAHDVLRILQGSDTEALAGRLAALCVDERCGDVTREAIFYARQHFSVGDGIGVQMVRRAVRGLGEDEEQLAQACVFLVNDLLRALDSAGS